MTFPAERAFKTDRRIKTRHMRVYGYLCEALDFTQIRHPLLETIHDHTGVKIPHVSRVLGDLVRWGYLIEHPRDRFRIRHFTLAWSPGLTAPVTSGSAPGMPSGA